MRTRSLRLLSTLTAVLAMLVTFALPASAAEPPVGLGTAGSFAVLAASTVTNTGPSVITGDLGVSPGTAVTGFPPGVVVSGTIYAAEPEAGSAQAALGTAYNDAAGRGPGAAVTELGGRTLFGGVYTGGALGITGALTLDAQGVGDTVWIFQAATTLTTASASSVVLQNGANPCNVFWQIGSSATLGTASSLIGTVMAQASVTATTGARVEGRLLARTGAVTLDSNVIRLPNCSVPVTTTEAPVVTTTTTEAPILTTTTTEAPILTTTTIEAPEATTTTIEAPEATTTTIEASGATTTTEAIPGTTTTTDSPATTTTTSAVEAAPVTTTTPVEIAAVTTTTTDDTIVAAESGTTMPPVALGQSSLPPTFGSPSAPAAPGAPSAPGAPAAPAAPGTPARPELPKTGGGLATTAAVGVLCLLLGELMVRRSRRVTAPPA